MKGALLGPLGSNLVTQVLPKSLRHQPLVQKAQQPGEVLMSEPGWTFQWLPKELDSSESVYNIAFLNVFRCLFQKCSWAGPSLSSAMGNGG